MSGQHVDAQPALSLHCAQVPSVNEFSSKRFQLNVLSTCSGQFLIQANLRRLQPDLPGAAGPLRGWRSPQVRAQAGALVSRLPGVARD